MRSQGFDDFVLQPPTVWQEPPLTGPDGQELEGYALVELHGFGITSGHLSIFESPNAPDFFTDNARPSSQPEDDAYLFALWSEAQVGGETVPGGCAAWAESEWENQNPEWAAGNAFGSELGTYMEEADNDARLVALDADLSICMAQQGYSIHRSSDIPQLVRAKIEAIPPGLSEDEYIRDLEKVRAYEIELAKAAWQCAQEVDTPERRAKWEAVQNEYREQFVVDNPELFEPFKDLTP